jgi:hypothetical protein
MFKQVLVIGAAVEHAGIVVDASQKSVSVDQLLQFAASREDDWKVIVAGDFLVEIAEEARQALDGRTGTVWGLLGGLTVGVSDDPAFRLVQRLSFRAHVAAGFGSGEHGVVFVYRDPVKGAVRRGITALSIRPGFLI